MPIITTDHASLSLYLYPFIYFRMRQMLSFADKDPGQVTSWYVSWPRKAKRLNDA